MKNIIKAVFGKKNVTPGHSTEFAKSFTAMQRIARPEGGWEPVGFDENGHYVILSRKTGKLVTLRPKQLDGDTLRGVVGTHYCNENHVEHDSKLEKDVFCPASLAEVIRDLCDSRGAFNPSKVRHPGFYEDNGRLVVHFGNEVYDHNGMPVDSTPGEHVYVGGSGLGFDNETPLASAEDVQELEEAVAGFNFRSRFDRIALLGWFVTAVFGQVAKHRPILAVTAERGSGKTTLIELLSALLGPQAFTRDGVPTVAQVIYELENRSAALFVDEFEARGNKKKAVEDFLELARTSFTHSESSRIARVIGGRSRFYNPPSGILLAGIALPAFDEASETRTVRVQMQPLCASGARAENRLLDQSNRADVQMLGARIRRLLVGRWETLLAAQKVVREILVSYGHEARAADKFTSLIAGYVALTSNELPARERLEALVEECQLSQVEKAAVERDCDACLSLLLSRRVVMFQSVDGRTLKSYEQIRDVVSAVIHCEDDSPGRIALIQQLEKFGLRPMWKKGANEWKLIVCTSDSNLGMRRLMQGTAWSSGGWKDVLARTPGAILGQQRVDGLSQKVVELPIPEEILFPKLDGDYELPQAA